MFQLALVFLAAIAAAEFLKALVTRHETAMASHLDILKAMTDPTIEEWLEHDSMYLAHIPRPLCDGHLERFFAGDKARLVVERRPPPFGLGSDEIWAELQVTRKSGAVAVIPYGDVLTELRLTALICSLRAAAKSVGDVVLVTEDSFRPLTT